MNRVVALFPTDWRPMRGGPAGGNLSWVLMYEYISRQSWLFIKSPFLSFELPAASRLRCGKENLSAEWWPSVDNLFLLVYRRVAVDWRSHLTIGAAPIYVWAALDYEICFVVCNPLLCIAARSWNKKKKKKNPKTLKLWKGRLGKL